MPHDTWRLLIDTAERGATNMARDEAIAATCGRGAAPPTLRLYRWRPACLSLGRFQRSAELDRDACARAGVQVVRRPSGGRALLHDDELTYAVVAPLEHPLLGAGSILESYRQISLALLAALRRLGADAALTPVERERRVAGSAACFDAPAAYELTVGGRKLAGSAQTRREGAILQHGAIPLTPHADRLAALLLRPPADLGEKMIALDQAIGRAAGFDEVAGALTAGFGAAWGVAFAPGELTDEERAIERRLRDEKYETESWTYAR